MSYEHTQRAPLFLLIVFIGVATLVGAWFVPERPAQIVMVLAGLFSIVLSAAFRQLTVRDLGSHLLVSFGPLPLFRRRVAYGDIERAEPSRSTFIEGWGIHMSPRGGWIWNIWGYDCVDLFLSRGRKWRIGTDDPQGLAAFLQTRLEKD